MLNFWQQPIPKNSGYNDFLKAVFSYGDFGAGGSSFVNLEISYNRYEKKIEINSFRSSFPIEIGKLN